METQTLLISSKKAWLSLLGGCLLHLVLGSVYLWGSIGIYVTSYYRILNGGNELKLSLSNLLSPTTSTCQMFGLFFGIPLTKMIGMKTTLFIGSLILSASVFCCSFAKNFWEFFALDSVVFGFMVGILYQIPFYNCYFYFPNKKGKITGLLAGCHGMASLISGNVARALINPSNDLPEKADDGNKYFGWDVAQNVPTAMRYIGILFLGMLMVSCLMQFPSSQYIEESQKSKESPGNWSQRVRYIFSLKFMHIGLIVILSFGFGIMMAINFKNYGILHISNDALLTLIGGVGASFNGGGRIVWGILVDKFDFKKTLLGLLIIQCIVIASISSIANNEILYFIWIGITLVCEGGIMVLTPYKITKIWGVDLGASLFSVMNFAYITPNFGQFAIIYFCQPLIGYEIIFWIYLGMTVVALLLTLAFKEEKEVVCTINDKENAKKQLDENLFSCAVTEDGSEK